MVLLSLHIGISSTLFVGLFFIIGIVTLIGLFPSGVMDWIERKMAFMKMKMRKLFLGINGLLKRADVVNYKPKYLVNPLYVSIKEFALLMVVLYCLAWNWGNIPTTTIGISNNSKWIGNLLRIDQNWGMFAPSVFKDDGWYIIEGTTKNDSTIIDLNREGAKVQYAKPHSIVSMFKNDRWRKYSENYLFVSNAYMRPYYCNYLLRKWNEDHRNNMVKEIKVIYMKEITAANYKYVLPKREVLCGCK